MAPIRGPATAAEGLTIVIVDGAAIAIEPADHPFGVDGATTTSMSADVGAGGADTEMDTGFGDVGSSNETNQDGGKSSE